MPRILVLPGDGIGVEVTNVSLDILNIIGEKHIIDFEIRRTCMGADTVRKGAEAPLCTFYLPLRKRGICL